MKETLVSTEELAEIVGMIPSTLRVYLGNYRLTQFVTKAKIGDRYKLAIKLNKRCAYKLCDVFRMHSLEYAVNNLEKYFEEMENGSK